MIAHKIQKALAARIGTLSTGWTVMHDHSSTAKAMPRILVTTGQIDQKCSAFTADFEISYHWLPDDTTDDAAHDVAESVRYSLASKAATVAAINATLNALGIDVFWAAFVGHTQGEDGARGRYIAQTYRLQFRLGA